MSSIQNTSGYSAVIYFTVIFLLGCYFTFASVQGDYGLFRRVQLQAETQELEKQRDLLLTQILAMRNKTHRLSDGYLDLELLDQQARDVLGLLRTDELVIR